MSDYSIANLNASRFAHDLAVTNLQWDQPVAIACSGGVDSTALLLLSVLARPEHVAPFVVVHVNHLMRSGSEADALLVAGLCASLEAPFVYATVDADWQIGDHVAEHRLRSARFEALARITSVLGIDTIVTAHTMDDQVETILMRLFGGAAPSGASGMRPEVTVGTAAGPLRVLRPLLGVTRRELVEILDLAQIVPTIDPSNSDTRYRRNALRSSIIPALRDTFPGFPATFLRSIDLARLDAEVVDSLAIAELGRLIIETDHEVAIVRASFRALPRAVATRIVIAAARSVSVAMDGDSRELTTERITAVVEAAGGRTGSLIQLPYGVDVRVDREVLVFMPRSAGDVEW
ncbi:MAG TPA: tRNA lysidine(34) synthetase TilS [Thermomicrobiales bacterium]|nr:tRNA lysidine(34) synthetase TilS [Thermomicrobiales bacterium]